MSDAVTNLLLLGAGHAHLDVLRQFAMKPMKNLRITLVAREAQALHAPMLPDVLYGSCGFDAAHTDLVPLAAAARARLILTEAHGIDLGARLLQVADRPDIGFDILSVDIGGVSRPSGRVQKSASESGIPLQPVSQFLARFGELEQRLPHGAHIAVVGNTPASVELVLALAHRFAGRFAFTLVGKDPEPLIQLPLRARRLIRNALVHAGVGIVNGVTVLKFDGKNLSLSDGTALNVSEALWATDAHAPAWLAHTAGLALTEAGAICVDATLRSISHNFVFASGSCAAIVGIPQRPDSAHADTQGTRTGVILSDNLRRSIHGQTLRMQPKPTAMTQLFTLPTVIRISDVDAVSWYHSLSFAGGWLLRWRNTTAQARLKQYTALNPATQPALQQTQPGAMQRALASLPMPQSPDLVLGVNAQSHAALAVPPLGNATVQSVSLLRAAMPDPLIAGEIAAAHAMGAVFAMGAHPWTAQALAHLPMLSPQSLENDLKLMLFGAARCLSSVHCMLIGGNLVPNSQTETLFGLSVTGLVRPEQAWSMHALRAGDALIITKPLGSGVIAENNTRGLVPARWLLTAITSMRRTDAASMDILRAHDVHACASLASAGLAGTVLDMLDGTPMSATLDQASIQTLPGARDLCSTQAMAPNSRVAGIAHPLLFAPMISGGLVASLPASRADACLQALRSAGIEAAQIGRIAAAQDVPGILNITGDFAS